MRRIAIRSGRVSATATLDDTPTAKAIWSVLPLLSRASRWGGEVYFTLPVCCNLEADARDEMPPGSLAYWTPGRAFCILFGPTPASDNDLPRLANPGNVFGQLEGDPTLFEQVQDGDEICVEKA